VNVDEDIDFGGDFPMDNAVDEEPNILPLQPIISPENLLRLQAQAAESVTIQEALDNALLNLTDERNAAMNREAQLAQSLQEATFNLRAQIQENENITAEKEVLVNDKTEIQRLLQETQISLQTQTTENVELGQLQYELNTNLRDMTNERNIALNEKASITQELMETRTLLEAQTRQFSTLAQQMEVVTGRESELALEKDAAVARGVSMDSIVTRLEQAVTNAKIKTAQEVNLRIVAEGNATNLNSLLLISEFSRVRLQDDNELLHQSAATLSNHRNQVMTENQTLEDSLASRQCEITRFKSTLNEYKKAVAEKNLEIGGLNAAYNQSIKLLDEKKQGIVYLIQEIKGLTQLLASQTVQSEKSLISQQNEITRLTAALNQSEKSIALKNEEFARLNAAYNQSIKVLDDEKREEGNTLLILVIAELERKLEIENQNDKERLSLTSRIVHLESANRDLNKYLTELKQKYQVNLEKLKLENTDYESNIHDLDLKLRQAIVAREEIEGTNRVLSEEKNIHRAEKDKLTKMLAAKDAQIKQLTLQEKLLIPRKPVRNVVFDSDTDNDEDTTLVGEPPDKRVDVVENPSDFQLGW
jgi:myosin heavy subunit